MSYCKRCDGTGQIIVTRQQPGIPDERWREPCPDCPPEEGGEPLSAEAMDAIFIAALAEAAGDYGATSQQALGMLCDYTAVMRQRLAEVEAEAAEITKAACEELSERRAAERKLASAVGALRQIKAVGLDNAPPTCNQRLALDFVCQVAVAALAAAGAVSEAAKRETAMPCEGCLYEEYCGEHGCAAAEDCEGHGHTDGGFTGRFGK